MEAMYTSSATSADFRPCSGSDRPIGPHGILAGRLKT